MRSDKNQSGHAGKPKRAASQPCSIILQRWSILPSPFSRLLSLSLAHTLPLFPLLPAFTHSRLPEITPALHAHPLPQKKDQQTQSLFSQLRTLSTFSQRLPSKAEHPTSQQTLTMHIDPIQFHHPISRTPYLQRSRKNQTVNTK